MNNLLNFLSQKQWFIDPSQIIMLENQANLLQSMFNESVLAAVSKKTPPDGYGYGVNDGIAVIKINGVLEKNHQWYMDYIGGMGMNVIGEDFKKALNDDSVESIFLAIDSPGGTVDGTADLASLIYESRGQKQIVSYADGLMASAAYYIGSAADTVLTKKDSFIGSIGVYTINFDYSKYLDNAGIKATVIKAGRFKAIGNPYEQLSKEGEAKLQEEVDAIYSMFVADVAKHRDKSTEDVLKDMADGRVFIGSKALEAGLVDEIVNPNNIIINSKKENLNV